MRRYVSQNVLRRCDVRSSMVRTALLQFGPSADRARNLHRVGALIDQAADRGAQLVLLPELFAVPFVPTDGDDDWIAYGEPPDGPSNELCRDKSDRHAIAVVSSYFESSALRGVSHNSV